jgi:hypothetical protein
MDTQDLEPILPTERSLAEQLERGEIVHFPDCPFGLPRGEDYYFLLRQRLASRAHKNIGYDPVNGKLTGYASGPAGSGERLGRILANFSQSVTQWLSARFPRYARGWLLDRVSYRPEQEATRRLRLTARNDLLHVDAFPSRPTNGWRILRVFANINPNEPRVWVTGEPFARLLERFGKQAGLPDGRQLPLFQRLGASLLRIVRPGRRRRSSYDAFMLRLHNYLKANADFQANCVKKQWDFQPNCAWLAITDTASHAVLSGRYALEHSYFLAPETLALPEESPPALLRKACGFEVLERAA